MRAILALLLLSLPARAATPELELGAGWFHGSDFSLDPGAAELALRLGAAVGEHLTLSGRLSVLTGSVSDDFNPFQPQPGVSGWSALAEARVHSTGQLQVHLAGGVGVAQLSGFQVDRSETRPLHGGAAVGWRLSTGLRLAPASWRNLALSLEGALSGWNGLEAAQSPGSFQRPPDPVTAVSILGGLIFVFGR
jgi:hypothetical protein